MSWRDDLDSDDDLARILAIGAAGQHGGPELVATLLDIALHDPGEVRTTGGMTEVVERPADVAARSIAAVLARHGDPDDRIRTVALDPALDDGVVGRLLLHLGPAADPVRAELGASPQERLRLRALTSVRPYERTPELGARFLADVSPAVRAEALAPSAPMHPADRERALTDPDPGVRLAAARKSRHQPITDAVIAAARTETDPRIRDLYVEMQVPSAGRGYLINELGAVDTRVATRLLRAGDPGVAAAIASRALLAVGEQELLWLVQNATLPEMRPVIGYLYRHAPVTYLRHVAGQALGTLPAAGEPAPTAEGLDEVQRLTLLREVLRWAEAALGEEAGSGLKVWTAAPDDRTAAEWIIEHDWFGDGVQADLLHAAVDGDLGRALAAELRPGREAELLRLAHRFTAAQIRAGLTPVRPGRLNPLLLLGPDALRVQQVAVRLHGTVPLAQRFRTQEPASLYVPCPGCGASVQVMGDVAWLYHDDDRFVETEDGYGGTLTGDCPACGSTARAEVRVSQTRARFRTDHELTWDTVSPAAG